MIAINLQDEYFILYQRTSAAAAVDDSKDLVGECDDRRSLISVPLLISKKFD
jgi:hypothetical protein